MLEASNSLEKNEGKTEDEMFFEKTKSIFNIMGQMNKEENVGIWWDFYTDFFYTLAESDHLETYCKYITQSTNENSHQWLKDNEVKLDEFISWLEEL